MKGTLNIAALATEVFTTSAVGFGNFAAYLDLSNMVSGDEITVKQYLDVDGTLDNKIINTIDITFDDLVDSGDEGGAQIPFSLEASQTGRIGVELTAGTTPLAVGWRITNLADGT